MGGVLESPQTAKKDDVDESTAKPNSPGPGDERCDDSTAKKDDDDNDDEDATGKPDSPYPGDERRDNSTAKKDDVAESA